MSDAVRLLWDLERTIEQASSRESVVPTVALRAAVGEVIEKLMPQCQAEARRGATATAERLPEHSLGAVMGLSALPSVDLETGPPGALREGRLWLRLDEAGSVAQTMWCVLQPDLLTYYHTEAEHRAGAAPVGELPLRGAVVVPAGEVCPLIFHIESTHLAYRVIELPVG